MFLETGIATEVEREGKVSAGFFRFYIHRTGGMAVIPESRQASGLGLAGVDREHGVTASAGMDHMVGATPDRPPFPGIYDIKNQRRVDRDRWMESRRRLPGTIAHARGIFPGYAGRIERNLAPVASDQMACAD